MGRVSKLWTRPLAIQESSFKNTGTKCNKPTLQPSSVLNQHWHFEIFSAFFCGVSMVWVSSSILMYTHKIQPKSPVPHIPNRKPRT